MNPSITSFDDFREVISGYRLPRVLLAALELDLFTTIGDRTWTMSDLAKETQLSERGLTILCRNLAMVGVLIKRGDQYRNRRLAATALNGRHPSYRGDYLQLMKNHWMDWVRLMESVRSGRPIDHDVPDDPDYRRRFTWAMHHRTLETAPAIAAQVDVSGARTLLDLGGGPGARDRRRGDRSCTPRSATGRPRLKSPRKSLRPIQPAAGSPICRSISPRSRSRGPTMSCGTRTCSISIHRRTIRPFSSARWRPSLPAAG